MNAVSRNYRPADPAGEIAPAPRLIDMAEALRELAHSPEGATEQALIGRGFTIAEILEYAVGAATIAAASSQADAARFDRVPDMVTKAIAAMPHSPPRTGGCDLDGEGLARWSAFCAARAAFKLDPWPMQAERCLELVNAALMRLPLLGNERARIVAALAAHQKAARMRAGNPRETA